MNFDSKTHEKIFVSAVIPQHRFIFEQNMKHALTILWNVEEDAKFMVDNKEVIVEKNCVVFLTEFHNVDSFAFQKMNTIQFNRGFYCIETHDTETGCKGLLFYGASAIPKILIPEDRQRQFQALWETFEWEMEEKDHLKIEMLRSVLKRFLILSLRIYKIQNKDIPTDDGNVSLIREFNYLVEKNYKHLTKVADYAELLNKAPKTLSNLFNKFTDKTPLQVINERRLLEARRLLKYTDLYIQEIADELNFADAQAFSNFFRKRENYSPSQFRVELNS